MLKGILSISGQPGLFKLIAEAKNRIIVESIQTGKRMPASSTAKISSLEDIAIYTETGEIPLKEVLKRIHDKESGGKSISVKLPENELRKYFEEIVPDYDKNRVYFSDIKKIILWYNALHDHDLLDFTEEETEEESAENQSGEDIDDKVSE